MYLGYISGVQTLICYQFKVTTNVPKLLSANRQSNDNKKIGNSNIILLILFLYFVWLFVD